LMSSALWPAGTRKSGILGLSTAGRTVCNNAALRWFVERVPLSAVHSYNIHRCHCFF